MTGGFIIPKKGRRIVFGEEVKVGKRKVFLGPGQKNAWETPHCNTSMENLVKTEKNNQQEGGETKCLN